MQTPSNPPAFPCLTGVRQTGNHEFECDFDTGASLRDYFAASALQGLLAAKEAYTADADASRPMEHWSDFATGAYQLADAMLAAREGRVS